MTLHELSAREAARRMAAGEISSEELVGACLERIRETDETVRAWAYLDPDHALAQARAADEAHAAGRVLGPLHGVPVAIKDIIDTADMPTENGSPLHAGRRPNEDASVVAQLRHAGAVIMGKTVTTEFALYSPGKTTNPHDPARTPGGSSSGSAAAVAAGMVPLALGTQTNGSVIRPGAFCGVAAFKPTHGTISRAGILHLSRALDTVGVFARSVEDLALAVDSMAAYDERDADMRPRGRQPLLPVAEAEPPLDPIFAFVRSPVWDQAAEDTREAFAELVDFLGEGCDEIDLPEPFDQAVAWHGAVMSADVAKALGPLHDRAPDQISDSLADLIRQGREVRAVDYNRALDRAQVLNAGLDQIFERYDAILTPATTGEAPVGLESTGNPVFCSLWTFCGVPAVSLPLLTGANGLPIGVQIVGRRGDDARLLRTARWLAARVAAEEAEETD